MIDLTPEQRAAMPCYIARTTVPKANEPVGTIVGAAVDEIRMARDNAKAVAKWIRDGLTVERVPTWWVRQHYGTAEVYRPEVEREAV